ncbi:MAG: gliding motility protein GldM [Bacteroidota bacterium]|nr:gliding motility protein GldM [Bacteroidota bacterium]
MSGAKETPRQKMIGMMYLVLTAMLALNVSKDILNAFVIVNEGMVRTNKNFSDKIQSTYDAFEKAYKKAPGKVGPYYDKAKKAKALSEEMTKYIKDLRTEVIAYTDGIDKGKAENISLEEVQSKDNFDKPMEILIGNEDKNNGKGKTLKEKLNKFKKEMLDLIPSQYQKNVNLPINTEDVLSNTEKKKEKWETAMFFHTVLAADVALLNKLIGDVKNTEVEVVNELLKSVDASDFKFDQVCAKVIPSSNYVMQGEQYKADIILAAYDSRQAADITIGGATIKTEDGVGKYQTVASGEGVRKYEGVIKVKKADDEKVYPFSSEYVVARPSATISPTKMNVFYIGVDNPVSISVPGVPTEKIRPSISGGGQLVPKGRGEYIVRVTKAGTVKISVSAELGDSKSKTVKSMGALDFRCKRIPDAQANIGGKREGKVSKGFFAAAGSINLEMPGFDFDVKYRIVSFKFNYVTKAGPVEETSNSNRFTPGMLGAINNQSRGTTISFNNIKIAGPDGERTISPIAYVLQ